jgi:DUF971 family protein
MPKPSRIDVHPDVFLIAWDDGSTCRYPHRYLRGNCGCAVCVSERTGERLVTEAMVDAGVRPVSVERVGNYAIQVVWSDGHSTGIYPFDKLRTLCPQTPLAQA